MTQTLLDTIKQITLKAPNVMRQLADQHLRDDDPRIRLACLQAITRLGYTKRYDDVNYLRNDPNKWIRVQVLRALIAIGEDDEESIASDLTTYFEDSEPLVRLEAIYTMHRYNLQSYVIVSSGLEMLWQDDSRVWDSRGERISRVMLELFGEYDPSLFHTVADIMLDIEQEAQIALATSESDANINFEDDVFATPFDDSDADDLFSLEAVVALTKAQAPIDDIQDEDTLPDWLNNIDDNDSELPEHTFDDVPDWLLGDVDISPEEFAEMVEDVDEDDENDEAEPEGDASAKYEIPDWLRAGHEQDTGMIELDIFDDDSENT